MAKYYRTIPNTLKCKDCMYCYKGEGDSYARCHFSDLRGDPSWIDVPPCEEEWTEEVSTAEYYGYSEEECCEN